MTYEKWQCPDCGAPIGYLGRFFQKVLQLTPACKKGRRPVAVSQPTPHTNAKYLLYSLRDEFGDCFSEPRIMGWGGSHYVTQYRIDVAKWKFDKNGDINEDDPPLNLTATADSLEKAAEIIKTKLRLLA